MRWLKHVLLRSRRYDDLAVSIREHLEERIDELMGEGLSRKEAESAARREFGNVALVEERSREVWQWPTIESIWADVRFAIRQLIKSPMFSVTAVVTLALGIAVNATMFSMVSAFLMPRLPGRDPGRMVVVSSVNPQRGFQPEGNPVSAANYMAWRVDSRVFAEIAAADEYRTVNLAGTDQPEAIDYAAVSANYFSVFGSGAQLGRTFEAGEDQPGRDHVAILSHALWDRRFGSDPAVVGRTVRLNREDYVIVGVMGADFRLLGFTPQLWTPLTLTAADRTAESRKERSLYLFARLAPGVTLEQARAEMSMLARQAEKDFPATEKGWGASVKTLPDFLVYTFGIRTALAVIMTTVGFVLLIACANVAGLLLTRAAARQKEFAVRASLGASRVRIVRQLLTEGLMIALMGGGAGLLLSYGGIRVLRANLTFNDAISGVPLGLDRNVLLFVVAVSLVSAALSSLAPALRASRTQISKDLRSEGRAATAGRSHSRLRAALVGGEFAVALFLLIGSCLLIRGIYMLEHQKLGFRKDHLLTAGVVLDHAHYGDASQQAQFVRSLVPRLEQIPGVEGAAIASELPASGPESVPVRIKGEPELSTAQQRAAKDVVVTPGYFRVAGISLLRGRTFTDTDEGKAPQVVLVNQEFVHRYLHDRNPLGQQIQLDLKDAPPGWSEIVGVVSDVKSYSEGPEVDPEVYRAFLQRPVSSFSIMMRSNVEPDSVIPELRHVVADLDVELPLLRVMSMDGVIETQRNGNPLFTRMMATFAFLALMLAAVGIYGLIAYSVSQRTQEIGIRMALGAKESDISWMILREGLRIAAAGSVIGLVMALPLPKIFDSIFTGISVSAPEIYPIVLAVMLFVAMLATFVPARKAVKVDPSMALRSE